MVVDFFLVEVSKLVRRPASWILGALLLLNLVLFGYLYLYVYVATAPGSGASPEQVAGVLQRLLPQNVLAGLLNSASGLGAALALIFGALVVGGEYGWGTLKLVLSQRPGRLNVFFGKTLAVGAVLAGVSVSILAVGLACSTLIAAAQSAPGEWPGAVEMLKALVAGWLITAVWASLGIFLSVAFRDTALAIGVGLAYMLIVERLALRLPVQGDKVEGIRSSLLSENTSNLVSAFTAAPQASGGVLWSVVVIIIYGAVFLGLAGFLFRKRDV